MITGPSSMTEGEVTLVVVSERPEEVFSRIDGLTSIGPYKLLPSVLLEMEDRYLDTAGKELTRRKWALRLRNIARETRIALKGPSTVTDWGGVERVEMELPWNLDSLSKVLSELREPHLGVTLPKDWGFYSDPLRTLTAVGLQVVQHRKTGRRLKEVVKTEPDRLTAELALDSVVYFLAEAEVSHFEIEIEARELGDYDSVKAILEFLVHLFGSELMPWAHSKLATGQAFASLSQCRPSEEWLSRGRLTRAAYEMIAECLSEEA
jgi:inorganic triphosphatase YgiF